MHFTELDTPALCIDLDVLEKNIDDLQSACNRLEIPLRVHTNMFSILLVVDIQDQCVMKNFDQS